VTVRQLTPAQKDQLGHINQELAVLFTDFGNKVLADEDTWTVLETPEDLAGLSDSLRATFKAAAEERKLGDKMAGRQYALERGCVLDDIDATRPARKGLEGLQEPCDNGGANDTNALIAKIVDLRAQRVKLLGYPSHAQVAHVGHDGHRAQARQDLMMRVWPAAVARVHEEVRDMQKIADKEKTQLSIEPWDYLYYAEKVRQGQVRPR